MAALGGKRTLRRYRRRYFLAVVGQVGFEAEVRPAACPRPILQKPYLLCDHHESGTLPKPVKRWAKEQIRLADCVATLLLDDRVDFIFTAKFGENLDKAPDRSCVSTDLSACVGDRPIDIFL